jgi:hypothetical protein
MHRTARPARLSAAPRIALLAAVLVVALLGAGCATTVTGRAAPTGASSGSSTAPTTTAATTDAVTWVDNVCGALLPFVTAASTEPKINPSDPAAAIRGLSTYLGTAVSTLDKALSGLRDAGPSPVKGGDEVVTTLSTALTKFRTTFQNAKTKIDAVDPNDPAEIATALPEAIAPLQELSSLGNPTADLKSSPELDRAAKQAPNCKALDRS